MGSTVRAVWSSPDVHNRLLLLHYLPSRMRCGTKRRGTPSLPIPLWLLCGMSPNKFRSDLGRHVRSFFLRGGNLVFFAHFF